MLVDHSGRVWAMRHDPMSAVEAVERRKTKAAADAATLPGSDFARLVDGVAIIPAMGPLMTRYSFWWWSYEELSRDLAIAMADDRVEAILFDIDSPGGMAAGCSDFCREIATARSIKPISAWSGSMCASAAYMIGASCSNLFLGSGAMVGSVGAVIEYVDLEPMLKAQGAEVVRVVSEQSPNKRLETGSEALQAELQALVNAAAADFIDRLVEGRGVTADKIARDFGQGLVFDGADALPRGMIDAVQSRAALLGAITAAIAAQHEEISEMDWDDITAEALAENRADLAEQLRQEGAAASARSAQADEAATAQAVTAAVAAERERVAAIDDLAIPGHETLIANAKADGTAPEAVAMAMVRAEKAKGADRLTARRAAESEIGDLDAAPISDSAARAPSGATDDDSLKSEWDRDAKVRDEFSSFETFAAFRRAQAKGLVRRPRAA